MPEGGVPRDEAGVGRACAPNPDELPGDARASTGVTPNMTNVRYQNKAKW